MANARMHDVVELPLAASPGELERIAVARKASAPAKTSKRRRRIDPTTTDIEYDADEVEFMMAIQRYKEEKHRPFPTLKETLEVLKSLGYRKTPQVTAAAARRVG